EAFCALWEIPAPRTEGQPLYELGIPLADAAHLRTCLEEVLAGQEVVGSVEIEQPASPVPRRLRLTARPLGHEPGQSAFILLAAEAVAADPAH
ncbi:MAG: hypothetical protein KJZ87_20570, partial [Thermoguttaceae bacterium]|nr:hypothetical protein [Thermoguttaceae bacterium]